jgi:hypothetical protein
VKQDVNTGKRMFQNCDKEQNFIVFKEKNDVVRVVTRNDFIKMIFCRVAKRLQQE